MSWFLAQSAVGDPAKPVPTGLHELNLPLWVPNVGELSRGLGTAAAILLAGLIALRLLRSPLRQFGFVRAFVLLFVTLAAYFGLSGMKPDRMLDATDPLAMWVRRLTVAVIAYVFVRAADRFAVVPLLTRGGRLTLPRFVRQIILLLLTLFAVLGYGSWAFGWDIDRFLAGSAVVSIVLGLALQETLGNFFSGLVMQASSPFRQGDWISCGDVEGRVVDMNWRAVTLHTADDNFVLMPNSTIAKDQIVNYNAPTRATAHHIRVGLEYDLAPNEAIEVLRRSAAETEGVIQAPPPFVFLEDYADSSIVYRVKFWIDEPQKHPQIEHAVRVNAWYRLKQAGYGIPFQIQTVEMVNLGRKLEADQKRAAARRREVLDRVWLFAPLSSSQRGEIAQSARDVQLAPGQTLFRQGDSGESFFVVERGELEVLVGENPDRQVRVATLRPGDFFGEMSALTGQPRSATIRASTGIWCVEIGKTELHSLFAHDPSIMEKLSRVVAERQAGQVQARQGTPAAEREIANEQRTLMGRMMGFFGLDRGDSPEKSRGL